jgi:Ku protein
VSGASPWPRVPPGRVISSCPWFHARSRFIPPCRVRSAFNRINKKTGNRLKQQLVDAETGETVEKEDIGRGYEIGKSQYLQVEDEEIEKIRIESSHTIAINTFVPRSEIDDRYIDDPYYIAPTDKVGQEAFAVIRDAIRDKAGLRWAVSFYRGASMS